MTDSLPQPHLRHPKLRHPIELRVEEVERKPILIIRCPLGISSQPLGLIPEVIPIIELFDGNRSVELIAEHLKIQGATPEIVLQLAELLDNHLYLVGPTFRQAKNSFERSFRESSVRPAALSGLSYSNDPKTLRQEIEQYLAHGTPQSQVNTNIIGLMTPHIDYRRGHQCYGRSFSVLENVHPDTVILIGTSHQFSTHLFHLTLKNFDCPLGTLKNEEQFTTTLISRYGKERALADEFLHKQEHSLELQIPFLSHLTPNSEIVPILVGSFYEIIQRNSPLAQYEPYDRFIDALAETIDEYIVKRHKSVLVLCGVDMAHIGKHFGDKNSLTPRFLQQIRSRDEEYLKFLSMQDKEALLAHIREDRDARRICGFPTMYTVLDLFKRLGWTCKGELIDYQQAVNYQTDCAVTFAGMSFLIGA